MSTAITTAKKKPTAKAPQFAEARIGMDCYVFHDGSGYPGTIVDVGKLSGAVRINKPTKSEPKLVYESWDEIYLATQGPVPEGVAQIDDEGHVMLAPGMRITAPCPDDIEVAIVTEVGRTGIFYRCLKDGAVYGCQHERANIMAIRAVAPQHADDDSEYVTIRKVSHAELLAKTNDPPKPRAKGRR